MTDIEIVRQKHPTSCCVHTVAQSCENGSEYRIWPTSGWFECRWIGKGQTKDDAWKDAANNIEAMGVDVPDTNHA